VNDECIHGFPAGMCAICFPKVQPEQPRPVRAAPRARRSGPAREAAGRTRAGVRAATNAPPAPTALEQRLYHVTHVDNLPGIFDRGALVAGATPEYDIASAALRSERATTPAPGVPDRAIDEYVPFFLSPDAVLWQALRDGTPHPRLDPRVSSSDSTDFVFFVSTLKQLVDGDREFVLSDANLEGAHTRFATSREDSERMLGRLRADDAGTAILDAEFGVFRQVPLELIGLVSVANDKVRSAVRDLLAGRNYTPKISVYPPWFQRGG
jgi:hypothetical protein